jgi:hypothetical protein
MFIRSGIENNNDDRSIAWALEHPGCFAYGANAAEAEANMPAAVEEYADWVRAHDMKWMDHEPLGVSVEETFDAYRLPFDPERDAERGKGPLVESFFRYGAEPLTGTDVERALKLLDWGRKDLLDSLQGLSAEQLNAVLPGERWSINGVLLHVAHAEWWYQACVSPPMPPKESDLPAEPLECLDLVRAHFLAMLPKQEGLRHMIDVDGETWSFRKMLRRAAWHERDHTQHIRKLI